MSDSAAPSVEAQWLRENWNEETLGRYAGWWIAVKGRGVEMAHPDLNTLLAKSIGFDPLYAFVHLEPLQ